MEKFFLTYRLSERTKRIANVVGFLTNLEDDAPVGECAICLDVANFIDMAQTQCNHIFHIKCITESVMKCGKVCPNCRSPIIQLYHSNSLSPRIVNAVQGPTNLE